MLTCFNNYTILNIYLEQRTLTLISV